MKNVEELLDITRHMIRAVDYCFLITLDDSGLPNARLLQHFKPDDSLTIWFGTSPKSRKIQELKRDNRLTVAFYHADETAYVILKGTARLVDDLDKRKTTWYEHWIAFFPAGPAGDDYMLIEFTPTQIELMNFAKSITPPPFGLQHVNLVRDGEDWEIV